MLLSWWKTRRRRRLAARPIPDTWQEILARNFAPGKLLSAEQMAAIQQGIRVLVGEKYWEGCGGLVLTDEIQVTIAAWASLLLLGLEHDYYPRVKTILVYPKAYLAQQSGAGPDGVVRPAEGHLGEAWYRGPVILSWSHVRRGIQRMDGTNLVIHEFAHQLDMEDQAIDGTPPLHTRAQYDEWQVVLNKEYAALVRAADQGRPTLLDEYGATDRAEFFAVASEAFFELPRELAARHPPLYAILRDFYGQDPAAG